MSLSVHVYVFNEAGEMDFQDTKDYSDTLAGFEVCRISLYGSETAKKLGLILLPRLAVQDIYASGTEVINLQTEAEIILDKTAKFAEQAGLSEDYVRRRVENVQNACIRARKMRAGVIIW